MRTSNTLGVLLAATLASACARDSPTAVSTAGISVESAVSVAAAMVPFSATYYFTPGLTPVAPEICPSELADMAVGHGEGSSPASFAGSFTGSIFSCVDLETLRATDGAFRFTASEGSRAVGTYELSGEWIEPGVLAVEGPFTIRGGTRRLRNATGGGMVTGQINFVTGEGVLIFDGEVSRP
ncbi:MAG: hypothetical protein M3418_06680 [Gemmatimonadota bacterium]|jgi:hypothetical protein|nr:hypothetical protein [Gemmatimonadota bacterium]